MATDIVFPLYEILVENIFGSVSLAIVGMAVMMLLILSQCKTSWTFMVNWFVFYFLVMGTLNIGAIGLVLGFLVVSLYTIIAGLRLFAATYLNL